MVLGTKACNGDKFTKCSRLCKVLGIIFRRCKVLGIIFDFDMLTVAIPAFDHQDSGAFVGSRRLDHDFSITYAGDHGTINLPGYMHTGR